MRFKPIIKVLVFFTDFRNYPMKIFSYVEEIITTV